MKQSLKTISEMTGYSAATVSRALSNSANVREGVKKKIILAAREIGYISFSPRVLVVGEMLAPSVYYECILSALSEKLHAAGFSAEFIAKQDVSLVLDKNFSGAVSLLRKGIEDYWGRNYGVPLVCINSAPLHLHNIYSVYNDDTLGCRSMVQTLVSLGHKKIGIYGESLDLPLEQGGMPFYLKRREAFSKTLQEYGLPDDLIAGRLVVQDSFPAVKSLLDRGCTAIIGNGESSSLELMTILRALNVKVPEEVSVMGWVSRIFQNFVYPPMSGVMQNDELLAEKAVEMLRKQINGIAVADICIPPVAIPGATAARCRK